MTRPTEIELWCEGTPTRPEQGWVGGPHPRERVISFRLDGTWPDGHDFWEITYAPCIDWQRIVSHEDGDAPTETRGSVLYSPTRGDVHVNLKAAFRGEPTDWELRERLVICCPHEGCPMSVRPLRRRVDRVLSGMRSLGVSESHLSILNDGKH